MDQSGVDGIMIGRGALIKPWIFTEIKERREWDISSRERLELVRKVGIPYNYPIVGVDFSYTASEVCRVRAEVGNSHLTLEHTC